jgi:hypothetical protein
MVFPSQTSVIDWRVYARSEAQSPIVARLCVTTHSYLGCCRFAFHNDRYTDRVRREVVVGGVEIEGSSVLNERRRR